MLGIGMWAISAYSGLFLAAFGAATLLPLQSEAVLVALLLSAKYPVWALLLVATTGNVLGSVVNWLLGRYIERWRHKRWFPLSDDKLRRSSRFTNACGTASFGAPRADCKRTSPRASGSGG